MATTIRPANYYQMSPQERARWDAEFNMSPEDRALWEYQNAGNEFVSGGAPTYEAGSQLQYEQLNPQDLARLQGSAYNNITTDPNLANAELDALSSLEERAKGSGLSLQDESDMARLQGQVNTRNRGRQGAIQQDMKARGMTGSGMDLVARMQAAQDSTETEALAALEKAAMAQAGQRDATDRLGARASSMRGQQFNEQAQKAQAQDTIARFNAQNQVGQQQANWQARNQATQGNWQRQNATADRNTASQYDYRKDKMGVQQGNAQMSYNKATDDYNRKQLEKQQKAAKKAGVGRAVGAVAGGALGASAGPMGAMVGAQVGGGLGEGFGYFAHGGRVPGASPFPGDDEMNDIFSAQLSPGEVVVPKTLADDPNKAGEFVAAVNQGLDPMAAKYIAQNDQQKAAESKKLPFYPTPTGAPIPGMPKYDRRTDGGVPATAAKPAAKPIDDKALEVLAQKNPSLVEQYRERMRSADQGVADAQKTQGYMDLASVAGKGLNDFANSQKQDVILKNRMQDLGKSPDVVAAKRSEYDGSMLSKLGERGVNEAKDARSQAEGSFFKEQQLSGMDRESSARDPNSEESKAARAFLTSLLPSAAKNPAIASMSAAQLKEVSPLLMQKFNADRAQDNFNTQVELDRQKIGAASKKPLNEGQQKTSDYASATMVGLRDMRGALKSGDNTFSLVGDNNFTEARRRAAENFGRLQSGGAISKDEEERFIKMLPTWTDSPEMQERKLAKLEAEMGARIKGVGGDPESAMAARGNTEPSQSSEVKRRTKDGKIAVFDANTKEFIRYE